MSFTKSVFFRFCRSNVLPLPRGLVMVNLRYREASSEADERFLSLGMTAEEAESLAEALKQAARQSGQRSEEVFLPGLARKSGRFH